MINLKTKTKPELVKLIDTIKVSDLEVSKKDELLKEIDFLLTGRRFNDIEILKDIEENKPDISDIKLKGII